MLALLWRSRKFPLILYSILFAALHSAVLNAQDSQEQFVRELTEHVRHGHWNDARRVMLNRPPEVTRLPDLEHDIYMSAPPPGVDPEMMSLVIQSRARATEALGLDELALERYEELASADVDRHDQREARLNAAKLAWQIASRAAQDHDFQRARTFLQRMQANSDSLAVANATELLKFLDSLIATPNDIHVRQEFAVQFWGSVYRSDPAAARAFLEKTLELDPKPEQRAEIYRSIQQLSFQLNDNATAERFALRLAQEFPDDPQIQYAADLTRAEERLKQKNFKAASAILSEAIEKLSGTDFEIGLRLKWAEVLEQSKRTPEMLEQLRIVVARCNGPKYAFTKQTATRKLAEHYLREKDFAAALHWYEQWRPVSLCGNGLASMKSEHVMGISECLIELGRADEALNNHLLPFANDPYIDGLIGGVPPRINQLIKEAQRAAKKQPPSTWIRPVLHWPYWGLVVVSIFLGFSITYLCVGRRTTEKHSTYDAPPEA